MAVIAVPLLEGDRAAGDGVFVDPAAGQSERRGGRQRAEVGGDVGDVAVGGALGLAVHGQGDGVADLVFEGGVGAVPGIGGGVGHAAQRRDSLGGAVGAIGEVVVEQAAGVAVGVAGVATEPAVAGQAQS